jgi:hypothetical protein
MTTPQRCPRCGSDDPPRCAKCGNPETHDWHTEKVKPYHPFQPAAAPTGTPQACEHCGAIGETGELAKHFQACPNAPTGTGGGSERRNQHKAFARSECLAIERENAALRSQLDEARDYGAHWNGKYIQAERDLATLTQALQKQLDHFGDPLKVIRAALVEPPSVGRE